MTISYLGPEGSFTEQALNKYNINVEKKQAKTIREVLENLQNGNSQKAIVPIENSTEGVVNITIDSIIFDFDFYIENMIILPIVQNLLVKKDTKKEDIRLILSHPQALAQCEKYLKNNFSGIEFEPVSSTSEAAKKVSESSISLAAIASEANASLYGLLILDKAIQDSYNNQTEFVILSKQNKTITNKAKRVSLAFSTNDKPGDLYRILNIFALWDINISKIFSRPMKGSPGCYVFYLDIENSNDLNDAFCMIKRKVNFFKFLGAYEILDFTKK